MKRHPIYVARMSSLSGCGHQHQLESAARNCALNNLRRHKTLEWADIVRVRRSSAVGVDVKEVVTEHIERTAL